ncbi:hypothetical protein AC578_4217 [Pseudocercospora eumusae]|uniref:Uncharacterized protein n=1 Tax=Pseudocercospora eumusae TaxID=321146 RepID=A0A139H3C0_9PEZI|nr:hypothetical protein AC578_4217 [Pseudocercospora eumusae]
MPIHLPKLYAASHLPPHNLDKYNLEPEEESSMRQVIETSIRHADQDRQRERQRRQSRDIRRRFQAFIACMQTPYVRCAMAVIAIIIALVFPFLFWLLYKCSIICDYKVVAIASYTVAFFTGASDYCLGVRNLQVEISHSSQTPAPVQLTVYTSQSDLMLDKHFSTTLASQALFLRLRQLSSGLVGADDIVQSSATIHSLCTQSLRQVSFAYPKLKEYLSSYSARTRHLHSAMSAISSGPGIIPRRFIPHWLRPYTQLGRTELNVVEFYSDFIADTQARQVDAQTIVNMTKASLAAMDKLNDLLSSSGQTFSEICIPYLRQVEQRVTIVYQLIQYVKLYIPWLGSPDDAFTDSPIEQCVLHGEGASAGQAYADLIVELKSNLTTIQADAGRYKAFYENTLHHLKKINASAKGDEDGAKDENARRHASTRKMHELHKLLVDLHNEHKRTHGVDGEK